MWRTPCVLRAASLSFVAVVRGVDAIVAVGLVGAYLVTAFTECPESDSLLESRD